MKSVGKLWKIGNTYTNYKDMLKNEEIDILSVCTNEDTHYEIVCEATNYNIKCIFCEKPLSNNINEARDMVKACEDNNIKLVVNCSRRWFKTTRIIRYIIREGSLGKLISITGHSYPGILYTGVHLLDNMLDIGGEGDIVYGFSTPNLEDNKFNNEDGVAGIIRFKNGAFGFIDLTSGREYQQFELEIHLEKGKILVSNLGATLHMFKWGLRKSTLTRMATYDYPFRDAILNAVVDIIECIEKDIECISNGRENLRVLETIDAFKKCSGYTC